MHLPPVSLVTRDPNAVNDAALTPHTFDLLLTLLVFILISASSAAALLFMRRRRRANAEAGLPLYNKQTFGAGRFRHRRTPSSISAPVSTSRPYRPWNPSSDEKFGAESPTTPSSPLPEIRIHFPEDVDESGNKRASRVVAVRVGENGGIGLEPVEEHLPPYQKETSERFQSLDMDRLGGLKEKEPAAIV